MNHTPTNGFEFPPAAADKIDTMLRESAQKGQPLRSVRPDRQPPVVTMTMPEPVQTLQSVPVKAPDLTPKSEVEGVSVDLPSRFFYYDFKDLYVKPFRVRHLAKLAKGHEQKSMQIIAEVVSSVLSTTSGDYDDLGFRLSMNDFNYVLYWLRLHSFVKPQMRLTSKCTNPEHIKDVEAGTKPKESLTITTIFKDTDLAVSYMDDAPDPETYHVEIEGQRVELHPETVLDAVHLLDHPNFDDEEVQYNSRIASCLKIPGASLTQKIELIKDMMPEYALLALEFAELVFPYGVVETINTNCIGCGASGRLKIAVDAPSFLSPQF